MHRRSLVHRVAILCRFLCVPVALLFLGSAAYGGFTHEISTETVGRPVVWGKPLAGGAIRALFVAPRFTLGDVAQLAARLDLHYDTVALWDAFHIGYDPMAFTGMPENGRREHILERFESRLKGRLDVLVLANFDTDILPESLFSTLLERVEGGMGLLLVHVRNRSDSPLWVVLDALEAEETTFPLWHGVAGCAFPGNGTAEGLGQVFRHGAGRIVTLEYLGDPPHTHCLIQPPADALHLDSVYEDNAYSLAARAVCLAAGRLGGDRIAAVRDIAPAGPQEDEIPPDFYPELCRPCAIPWWRNRPGRSS